MFLSGTQFTCKIARAQKNVSFFITATSDELGMFPKCVTFFVTSHVSPSDWSCPHLVQGLSLPWRRRHLFYNLKEKYFLLDEVWNVLSKLHNDCWRPGLLCRCSINDQDKIKTTLKIKITNSACILGHISRINSNVSFKHIFVVNFNRLDLFIFVSTSSWVFKKKKF